MSGNTLAKHLAGWVGAILNAPGTPGREHCFQVRPQFRIPGAGRVDLLTVRHESGRPDRFRVDLWNILPRTLDEKDLDGMMRRLHAFDALYAELIEHAETQGFSPGHRVSIRGNLVGKSIHASPFVDLLRHWGSSIFFWTWKRVRTGIEVQPSYDRAPSLRAARAQLKGLLDHLPWEDTAEREEPSLKRPKATC
ncbi:MAG: hypothetical protein JO332_13130 [Planctomycetaceae bacterium]|nr:hypothetical protein [Planctomycetaceae bacterium]